MSRRISARVLAALITSTVLAATPAQAQTTWYVDDDAPADPGPGDPAVSDPLEDGSADHPFDAIQEGIDAALDGDTVLVLDGTYTGDGNRDLDYGGEPITVRSANGPDACVIDCEGQSGDQHRGFHFHSGETAAAVVEGLTVTNGYAWDGGGAYCENSSDPTFLHCVFARNGGEYGGGIRATSSSPTITQCRFEENMGATAGGGIYVVYSGAAIADCTFMGNASLDGTWGYGGGIYCAGSGVVAITRCAVGQSTANVGGGICIWGASPVVAECRIVSNTCTEAGGGVYCGGDSAPTLVNSLIRANSSDYRGGGMYCLSSQPVLVHCTLADNTAPTGAGLGVNAYDGDPQSLVVIANSILWNDLDEIWIGDNSAVNISYSDVRGSWPGEGNIESDPAFAFADDLHVTDVSPCIDAGTNDPPGGLPDADYEGTFRPLDGDGDDVATADLGAYEFSPDAPCVALSPAAIEFEVDEYDPGPAIATLAIRNCGGETLNWAVTGEPAWLEVTPDSGDSSGEVDTLTLSADGSGLAPGTYAGELLVSDAQAVNSPRRVDVSLLVRRVLAVPSDYDTIQAAVDAAVDGDAVVLADGTYTGDGNRGVLLHGKEIVVRSANGRATCVIDCQGMSRAFCFCDGETAATVLQGVTIMNGDNPYDGGGIMCIESSPTIRDCVITQCTANRGGGVFCRDGSQPVFVDCLITDNTATENGAGLMCNFNCDPTLANCVISNNACYGSGGGLCFRVDCGGVVVDSVIADNWSLRGGGISCVGGTTQFVQCIIAGNSVEIQGGGIDVRYSGQPEFLNSLIAGNQAPEGGGLYCTDGSSPSFVNCTLAANSATSGRAVYLDSAGAPSIANSILWNGGDEIQCTGSTLTISYSDIYGGWEGTGNIDADPLFADPDGSDDDPATWEDNDYRLAVGSPCIDGGDNSAVPPDTYDLDEDGDVYEPSPFDLDGDPRFVDDIAIEDTGNGDPPIIDMGAFEFQGYSPGDLNCDGIINAYDIDGFILAVSSYPDFAAYYAVYPDCDPTGADCNLDGIVNSYDIDPFIDLVAGG